jgi:hypothetical protein
MESSNSSAAGVRATGALGTAPLSSPVKEAGRRAVAAALAAMAVGEALEADDDA